MSRRVLAAAPRSGANIDNLALRLIRRFQPEILQNGQAFDVESFFELDLEGVCGIKTDYRELPPGIYGVTDSERQECIVSSELMSRSGKYEQYFARSTIAHEIFHALIHVPEFRKKRAILKSINDNSHNALSLRRQEDIPVYMNPEWQAFRFGGALLMPDCAFRKAINDGAGEYELTELFKVNPAFVRSRAKALKIWIK